MLYIYGRRWCALYAADSASGLQFYMSRGCFPSSYPSSGQSVGWGVVILTTSAEYLPFLQIQPQVIVPIVDGGLPFGTSSGSCISGLFLCMQLC